MLWCVSGGRPTIPSTARIIADFKKVMPQSWLPNHLQGLMSKFGDVPEIAVPRVSRSSEAENVRRTV